MSNRPGDFIWYELMTGDVEAASRFYAAVVGWRVTACGEAGDRYRIFQAGEIDVAGAMPLPSGAGLAPAWLGYIAVDDVDAAVADIVDGGGALQGPAIDVPEVGRFAVVADPQGAVFHVMKRFPGWADAVFEPSRPGHCQWHELGTGDPSAALAFYGERFGWEKGEAMDLGEMGEYQFIDHGGRTIGALMKEMEPGAPPRWRFYFGVEDIDVATTTAIDLGAVIHFGPAEVPGSVFILVASDPQGAPFALVGPRASQRARP